MLACKSPPTSESASTNVATIAMLQRESLFMAKLLALREPVVTNNKTIK